MSTEEKKKTKKQKKNKKNKNKNNKTKQNWEPAPYIHLVFSMPQMVIIQNVVSNDNPRLRAAALLNPFFVLWQVIKQLRLILSRRK